MQNQPLDLDERTRQIFSSRYQALACKTDRLFIYLFVFQWLIGIAFALFVSPLTWSGEQSQVHIHVYAAIFLGGLLAALPIFLALSRPGTTLNRAVITFSQISFSILFIHLMGGRIETHFHVFGSLAFLAIYRDWRTVVAATVITAIDHFVRGIWWPASVYGVLTAAPWRAFEHSAWVLFEDVVLLYSIHLARQELMAGAAAEAKLEFTVANIEKVVHERTQTLIASQATISQQQETIVFASKMASLGEMAGGIAHEINNPLAIIRGKAEIMLRRFKSGTSATETTLDGLEKIITTTDRIAEIVKGLRLFSRNADQDPFGTVPLEQILRDTMSLCAERFKMNSIEVKISGIPQVNVDCRATQIVQVLVNLLSNSFDAIQPLTQKWVKIETSYEPGQISISVTDSGSGIAPEVAQKLMQPFFTTKEVGKGTGLGLSISKGIIESHHGKFYLDTNSPHTRFVIELPERQAAHIQHVA